MRRVPRGGEGRSPSIRRATDREAGVEPLRRDELDEANDGQPLHKEKGLPPDRVARVLAVQKGGRARQWRSRPVLESLVPRNEQAKIEQRHAKCPDDDEDPRNLPDAIVLGHVLVVNCARDAASPRGCEPARTRTQHKCVGGRSETRRATRHLNSSYRYESEPPWPSVGKEMHVHAEKMEVAVEGQMQKETKRVNGRVRSRPA